MNSLSTTLSYIKSQAHYVLENATLARYDCPNDAKSINDLDHSYLVEQLSKEIDVLLEYYEDLKVYLKRSQDVR